MRAVLPIALIAGLCAMALSACGGSDTTVVQTVTETGTTGTETSATGTETTAPPQTGASASSAPAQHLTGFQTPSQNIGCYMAGSNVRCDIKQRDWNPPPRPATCQLDFGQGLQIGGGRASLVCAGDTTLNPSAPTLAYGQSSRRGPFLCRSASAGVTCTNQSSGHGFFLSRQRYYTF